MVKEKATEGNAEIITAVSETVLEKVYNLENVLITRYKITVLVEIKPQASFFVNKLRRKIYV
jgi:hypothetical protein